MKLKGKVAVVTGGARDIGKAVSVKLAAEGAKVVVNYFSSEEQSRDTLQAIHDAEGEAIAVRGDMTKQEDVDQLVAKSVEAYGEKIDVLVNVVGGLVARKTIEEVDADFVEFIMKRDVFERAGGSMGHHFVQTMIYGLFHWKPIEEELGDSSAD